LIAIIFDKAGSIDLNRYTVFTRFPRGGLTAPSPRGD
jgi:hypothetical protein